MSASEIQVISLIGLLFLALGIATIRQIVRG